MIAITRLPIPTMPFVLNVLGMNAVHTATAPSAGAALRTVEAIHTSTTFHWVGDGFRVSTYFPSAKVPAERVSPFVLMDYGPPKTFEPNRDAAAVSL